MTRFIADPSIARYRAILLTLACSSIACRGDSGASESGDSGESGGGVAEIEFTGEQPFLPGFDYDTGWLPEGSPASVRATVTAGGGVTVVARASTDGDTLAPIAGSGSLSVEGSLALEVSARIDTAGILYEGVVESFEYAIEPVNQSFDPFTLDASVMVSSTLPATVLGEVPIPSVPGASLVLEVTGGNIDTAFQGTCADARDGFGQYAGALTMQGTVACAASITVEFPPLDFGPFAFDVPIPPIETAIDLGTRSLATGEMAGAMGICDDVMPMTSDDTGTSADDTAGDEIADTGADDADATGTDDATSIDPSDDDGDPTGPIDDPGYPAPVLDMCPDGYVHASVSADPPNAVCLPPCGADQSCPSGPSGSAIGSCDINPESTYIECASDIDCTGDEFCLTGYCSLQPSHCILLCDDTAICPDTMTCILGACTYAE